MDKGHTCTQCGVEVTCRSSNYQNQLRTPTRETLPSPPKHPRPHPALAYHILNS